MLCHIRDDEKERKEADCFARNLLCPVPLIDSFQLKSAFEYMEFFGVSFLMAEISLKLYKSDKYYITDNNYNKIMDNIFTPSISVNGIHSYS